MKIVVLAESLSEQMGYATNFFPKALAEQGHDVHLITSNTQAYFSSPDYKSIFEKFIGPGIVQCGQKRLNGYTLHRLPYKIWPRRAVGIKGLIRKIAELKPDIVHCMGLYTELAYETALAKPFLGYQFFVECHVHASVFPPVIVPIKTPQRWLYWRMYRPLVGKIVSAASRHCWAISEDAAEMARDYLGYNPGKISVRSLGTDTRMFFPWYEAPLERRTDLRRKLGFADSDIVCVYTGRMQEGKDPLILARAIDRLVKDGKPYRGLFIGDGSEEYFNLMKKNAGCTFLPFVPVDQLPGYYQAADIGVWPKQESTSQMDAAACALPLVLSNRIKVMERIDGNGLIYEENNMEDLAAKLLQLSDANQRRRMGEHGAAKMREKYSWDKIAGASILAYEKALAK